MGRGGYNNVAKGAVRPGASGLVMRGRGGYNDVHDTNGSGGNGTGGTGHGAPAGSSRL